MGCLFKMTFNHKLLFIDLVLFDRLMDFKLTNCVKR